MIIAQDIQSFFELCQLPIKSDTMFYFLVLIFKWYF